MALVLTEEQSMLRDSARGLISDKAPVSHLRHLRDSKDPTGFSKEFWHSFAEMGFAGGLNLWPVIPGRVKDADHRCAIAHRGISRFRVRCFASPRNDESRMVLARLAITTISC